MDDIDTKISELEDILSNLQAFSKQAFQPLPPAQQGGAAPPMGAPPMDPAMAAQQGGAMPPPPPGMDPAMAAAQGGAPPMDPAMMGGAPPAAPPVPPELEQAIGDMMSALEQVMMVVEQQKSSIDQLQQQVQESLKKSMELEAQVGMLDKALSEQSPYMEQQPEMAPADPTAAAMMGAGSGPMM